MSRRPDIGAQVVRLIEQAAERARCPVATRAATTTAWSSATFSGARHALTLAAAGSPALDAWIGGLAEADFSLPRHLIADVVVGEVRRVPDHVEIELELLTVEEG